ncbi:Alpha/Beta hydrolase protein, partial [Baffinella frigidus]
MASRPNLEEGSVASSAISAVVVRDRKAFATAYAASRAPMASMTSTRAQERLQDEPGASWWRLDEAPLRTGLTAFRLIGTEGPVILCLHGAFSFSYIYQDLVRRLQRDPHDHPVPLRILLLDFHGRGRSPWPGAGGGATAPPSTDFVTNATEFFTNSTESSNCTLELLATQVEGLLAHLGLATEPAGIIIVGHDMGAAVGAAVAARSPGLVSGLVMLSPAGVPREVTEMERALDTPLLGTWMFRSR